MLTLLRSTLASALPRSLSTAAQIAPTVSFNHARTFLTTRAASAPAAEAKAATKPKATKTVKKTTKAKKPAKKAAPKPKKAAEKKPTKPKKPTLDIPAEHLPPKRPGSVYQLFIVSRLKADPIAGGGKGSLMEWTKKMGAVWKAMNDAEKEPFFAQMATARANYEKELEKWIANTPPDVVARYRLFYLKQGKIPSVSRSAAKNRPDGLKKPLTPYMMFAAEQRKVLGKVPFTEGCVQTKEIGAKWRAMSDAEKDVYTQRYRNELAKYRKKVEEMKAAQA